MNGDIAVWMEFMTHAFITPVCARVFLLKFPLCLLDSCFFMNAAAEPPTGIFPFPPLFYIQISETSCSVTMSVNLQLVPGQECSGCRYNNSRSLQLCDGKRLCQVQLRCVVLKVRTDSLALTHH